MYGHSPNFRPRGGRGQPPAQPNMAVPGSNIYLNNLAAAFLQNPNFPLQNPNFPMQIPNFPSQQFPNMGFQIQNFSQNRQELLDKINRAVAKARCDLIAAGESVSAWKVSQSALLVLQVDSWSSLGFQMQEVPLLHSLMFTEGKINAFIHCFVGVRKITSIYDLEVAICKNEAVEKFEDLELGPLLRHPLVVHYFSVTANENKVCKLTSEEIIVYLCEFMDTCKRREIKVDEFLTFIAKKRPVVGWEDLGVRIQNLGMHICFIREAIKSEQDALKTTMVAPKQNSEKRRKHRPIFSVQKQQLDKRFNDISERVKSFSSVHKDFDGKHIRFPSSSSEYEDSDEHTYDDKQCQYKVPLNSPRSSDRVSNCPYPSATEEMTRLGLKCESEGHPSPASGSSKYNGSGPLLKKRKFENLSCTSSAPRKFSKRDKTLDVTRKDNKLETKEVIDLTKVQLSLSESSLSEFITTWKEACREHTVDEVFGRMINFYNTIPPRRREKMISCFSLYPFVGLVNIAVMSIKCGMWDSIYDTFQVVNEHAKNKFPDVEIVDVEPSEKDALFIGEQSSKCAHGPKIHDIIEKLATYFEHDLEFQGIGKPSLPNRILLFKKFCNCELWLAEQFCVKEFKSLGYGDLFMFLEQHSSILPNDLCKLLTGDIHDKSSFEVCMRQHQLVVLVSQASNILPNKADITKQMISSLLTWQFPLISFKIQENGALGEFLDIVGKQNNSIISKHVIFSASLAGPTYSADSLPNGDNNLLELKTKTDSGQIAIDLKSVTSKDAMEVLLRAPMLSDLNHWSHWGLIFAPSFGPLVEWLLNEMNSKDLLCLVTKDGKVIRIDHSATVDSFLRAAIEGSSFQTAVQLLSLFSVLGGGKNIPFQLLKIHAQHAFEVIIKNCTENVEVQGCHDMLMQGKSLGGQQMLGKVATTCLKSEVMSVVSRFFLDCLGYLPSEFRVFATRVLLSGLRSVVKDSPAGILHECDQLEQRLMLHEVGLSLGVVEWIDDYHSFYSTSSTELLLTGGASCLRAAGAELTTALQGRRDSISKFSSSECEMIASDAAGGNSEGCVEDHCAIDGMENAVDTICNDSMQRLSELEDGKDAALIVESIRREEFGLDASLSNTESTMLKKQHARLGRALHCLSQELYSQDSHFILELVQNADDNIYWENVEPTLVFILQETSIVVLNNERGFSAQNIRALCDVGNSTKKESSAGYIGKKGIGFKSVFRVSDTPEIHSNGFHVKFDIRDGQIGFVLPTVIPPCNIDLFGKLACKGTNQLETDLWNTCIVLPFRSNFSGESSVNNILTMFSDVHPSLLLFLHRLQCIKFRNMLNNSLIVMKKEIVGNGIVNVSLGEEKMSWLLVSQKLRADAVRPDVQSTEIAMAFTLQDSDLGDYSPLLVQQPVFSFLPLRTYGLKFILQGDFVLPSSREEVDGDSPWNQWLLSEFPGLFLGANKSFCALPCYKDNPGKAVSAFMSFVPLVGEVHGFFSSLPRMIINKLRMSNCLLLDGENNVWVPPYKVLRGWNNEARILLSDTLLSEHLGIGFLNKDIVLSDPLARALGIEEYGPKILLQIMSSLCQAENGLKSVDMSWLHSWLNAVNTMYVASSGQTSINFGIESDLIKNLQKIPFIPLSDGTYSSIDEGTIWLHSDSSRTGSDSEHGLEAFPNIYSKLRTVNPALLFASPIDTSCKDERSVDNLMRILRRIGVQQLSAHDITIMHILPAITDDKIIKWDKILMTEYLCFVMVHLQSSCPTCRVEREYIISELRTKAFILTNHGFKRPTEASIHFSAEYRNPVDATKLINNATDMRWHEVDSSYLNHPCTKSLSCGPTKWREFFQGIGVTDFVQVVQIDKSVDDLSQTVFMNMISDGDMIPRGSLVRDWESHELVHLLSSVSKNGNRESCKYLLEILDLLWDDCFSEKVTGYCNSESCGDDKKFKSSFIRSICDSKWVVSIMDGDLHYPKDLFYDCDAVRSILGASAQYAVPKVRNIKLVKDIGFKTEVTIDDILETLNVWRRSEIPFMASIAQMSKLYFFVWNAMVASKQRILEEFRSGPFIFVPYAPVSRHDDVVPGLFLSEEEVCWRDATGSLDQMKEINPQSRSMDVNRRPLWKRLYYVYPGLHDFFVNECGVPELPPFRSYLQILQRLSTISSPSQSANAVFQVFQKWDDAVKSGHMSSEDVVYLKECLMSLDYKVLPTVQNKWVSLHPSFGLVCWCDDELLQKEFKDSDTIDFLSFGDLGNNEKVLLKRQLPAIMQTLGIHALSEVVTREAIYYGPTDCCSKASLVNWVLPYAQRYMYTMHPDKYTQLKQHRFDYLNRLKVVVVEKLFYRNVIKSCGNVSKKRYDCSCLLEDNILYTTRESDYHSMFMELSCLLFDGSPQLHLSNFLHMITTMTESGFSVEQIEFFILNSQKVPELPSEESVWSLSSVALSTETDDLIMKNCDPTKTNEKNPSDVKRKVGSNLNWPPVDWKTAPGFSYSRANGFRTQAAQPSCGLINNDEDGVNVLMHTNNVENVEFNIDWAIEEASNASTSDLGAGTLENHSAQAGFSINKEVDPIGLDLVPNGTDSSSSRYRDQLSIGTPNQNQALITGKVGERIAFKYFTGKFGNSVKWVNEKNETGLPYDIVIRENEKATEYIEVKATKASKKDWFFISTKEWQFAVEMGESFSIAHVALSGNNVARITLFKNPVKLCQLGDLRLVVMMSKQQREVSIFP